ncbi:hypothetical protein WL02_16180 [Burkholderia ubonensis]|nr:hypothetical protein WL02_16180 [Burkholderia ubonensis]
MGFSRILTTLAACGASLREPVEPLAAYADAARARPLPLRGHSPSTAHTPMIPCPTRAARRRPRHRRPTRRLRRMTTTWPSA